MHCFEAIFKIFDVTVYEVAQVEGPQNNSAKYTELKIKALGLSFYTVIYIGLEIKAFGLSF